MPEPNRVTPWGEIVAIDQRGLFMGNRGCVHRDRRIVRPWQVRRWITSLSAADGWESEIYGPEDDLQFVGYVVGRDVPESA